MTQPIKKPLILLLVSKRIEQSQWQHWQLWIQYLKQEWKFDYFDCSQNIYTAGKYTGKIRLEKICTCKQEIGSWTWL